MIRRVRSYAAALLAIAGPAGAQSDIPRDWRATLSRDAQALHDNIAANHPGPVNPEDPGFARHNDAELKRALKRARSAQTYGDYYFALREYVSSFNDGHLSFGAIGATPNNFRWPGFLAAYGARGGYTVVDRADNVPVPIGARLVGCDGRSAGRFAAETLGRDWGRWELESQRLEMGGSLFVDESNRYVRMPKGCTFLMGGRRQKVTLEWRPIGFRELMTRLYGGRVDEPRHFGTRVLANGIRWYSLPSFNGDPNSDAGRGLPPLVAEMQADRATLARAPAIVLDLRRNDGGSSDWSYQIAVVLWGRAAINAAPVAKIKINWRASPANLAALETGYARRRDSASPEMRRWYESAITGIRGAIAEHKQLWRHTEDEHPASLPVPGEEPASPRLTAPIYFLTDSNCASACLDAVDLWKSLGAVHIGRTTSADTLYMDIRFYRLPSGITSVSMPMKVYNGRARGSNVPAVPRYRFDGDIADTPAVERWISTLPR